MLLHRDEYDDHFQNAGNYNLHFPFLESNPEILDGQDSQSFDDQSGVSSESENDIDDITSDLAEDRTNEVTDGNSYSLYLKEHFRLAKACIFPYESCDSLIDSNFLTSI